MMAVIVAQGAMFNCLGCRMIPHDYPYKAIKITFLQDCCSSVYGDIRKRMITHYAQTVTQDTILSGPADDIERDMVLHIRGFY